MQQRLDMRTVDLAQTSLRELNQQLHQVGPGTKDASWEILNARGYHSVAVGVDAPISIDVRGSVGYYCAGMNKQAEITVHGSVGPGVAETSCREKFALPVTPASTPAPPAAAGCSSSRATHRRAAACR